MIDNGLSRIIIHHQTLSGDYNGLSSPHQFHDADMQSLYNVSHCVNISLFGEFVVATDTVTLSRLVLC